MIFSLFILSDTKAITYTIEILSEEWVRNTIVSFLIIFSILALARFSTKQQNIYFTYFMGVVIFLSSIISPIRTYISGNFSIAVDLPFHLCGISALICSVIPFVKKKQGLFDFVFYTGIIGGIMGILTPQMTDYDGSFYVYFVFYVRHIIIFTMPIFLLQNLNLKLSKKSMIKTFLILNLMLVFIMPFNFYTGGNYMYLAEPPQVNNPLVIGQWPIYILWFEVFVIIFLIILYNLSRISLKYSANNSV
ncbi:MAG: TIGR02206 family membrane protein [Formosa sp.]|nr:TIGR02206 family membrane protein [Formosa sp.]